MKRPALFGRLLRLTETANYLGISTSSTYVLVERGQLRPIRLPGLRGPRFDRRELDAWIEDQKTNEERSE